MFNLLRVVVTLVYVSIDAVDFRLNLDNFHRQKKFFDCFPECRLSLFPEEC